MHLLLNLLLRIIGGEPLENGSRTSNAWWMSILFLIPPGILLFQTCFQLADELPFPLIDHVWGIILITIPLCLAFLAAAFFVARLFKNHCGVLLLLCFASWTPLAWLALKV
jgi:hypothetical protein